MDGIEVGARSVIVKDCELGGIEVSATVSNSQRLSKTVAKLGVQLYLQCIRRRANLGTKGREVGLN